MKTKKTKKQTSRSTPKQKRPLDPRRAKYVANRLKGNSKRLAAIEAGFSVSMAENASDKIENEDVTQALQSALRKHVNLDKLARRLAEGLDAGKTVTASFEGAITDTLTCVDQPTRNDSAMKIAKLMGVKTATGEAEAETGVRITVVIDTVDKPKP